MDQLEALDLINHYKGLPGQRGWQSAMCGTPELIQLVHDATEGGELTLAVLREPILLRDEKKNLVDYRDSQMTERMRRETQAQNEAIVNANFGPLLRFPGRLRRIFNGNFKRGGRFYAEGGSWQTLPGPERGKLTLNDEPITEIDFCSIHPVLAYAELGLAPPPDVYEIPETPRDLVKIAFSILLNSSSRNGARHDLAHKPLMARMLTGLEPDETEDQVAFNQRILRLNPMHFQEASKAADALIEAVLIKHDPIRSIFFSGAGLRLQRLDSDIAEGVMRRMRKQGLVVLPVHDSFIVARSKADLLEQAMTDEAAEHRIVVKCRRST